MHESFPYLWRSISSLSIFEGSAYRNFNRRADNFIRQCGNYLTQRDIDSTISVPVPLVDSAPLLGRLQDFPQLLPDSSPTYRGLASSACSFVEESI